ncbi:hypothetical protein NBH00_05120 [Paraconexibacter antarcticus]|uniref:Uncharacterized protein n=1 Tax=Paraconexibacter antarcticus TaxID=2949664 RepID=A0ABY5DV97_9ACTN|nr:hypothetical protein [Paraconexibacter antarcticus]UTI65591.1 hypothetical protein NBH00_05120 [Paraconexibacter antarcticus]
MTAVPRSGSTLTKPQRRVLEAAARIQQRGDTPSDGWIGDDLGWCHIPWRVTPALERKGLVIRGDWHDEEWGYDITVTAAGFEALR